MIPEPPNPETTSLDPDVRRALAEQASEGLPSSDVSSVETARKLFREEMTAQQDHDIERTRDFSVPGPESDVRIRIYMPDGEGPFPTIVFFHGGGWVLGDLDCYDSLCTHLASITECLVVSCEYRLAPEHPFPAAPTDCYAATEWVEENAAQLGGDSDQLVVAGTSAGGNLAAVVTLMARDRDGPDVSHQLLLYPSVNPVGLDRFESYETYAEGYALTTASLRRFYREYIQDPIDARNAYAFPLQSADLSDVAPATIVSTEFDPLRDEAFAYARKLEADGVQVLHHHFDSMTHDFLSMTDEVDAAVDGFHTIADDLARSLDG